MTLTGLVWRFGDEVDTDVLAPGIYMKGPLEELAIHCLESVEPSFAGSVQAGDIVVAGRNFGMGSSREQAAQVLKHLGVAAVIAPSFGGIFYRNAFNWGLPAIICASVDGIENGHRLELDLEGGTISNLDTGETMAADAIPGHLMGLIDAGGLVPYLEKKLK
ncbi:MAG: 3-isopropylmalate dehydratase [Rhodospirillales bacterium]|jgi:3-isopropylmalate/(R)-2-methylmalate dehydratase small subunit|nr:3-isopropylmalate dehydratase [Rhodospirillaceae bacterium]MDP6429178.1 3-isopropylmalate dehydratase [Rhodospirillales bacterium]MDP6646535.1 3-isopropylmalate dehydratase [Rhodospirillales bacterium]MDP6842197.1 3-isopropylmalate dehydratase [Rhodospirillales bacterium]|tara:strand:+ start:542 stop:1027 length:486 start_codon:yes stop_codon:yes gene_type:complete